MKKKRETLLIKKPIEITETIEKRSFALLHFVGYILLIFSCIDYLGILIPPRLTDPSWEFQSIGQLVDHVWAPLLGLTFLFLQNKSSIVGTKQLTILQVLSWFALPIGILYLLLLPLGINNSLTLYKSINNQFTIQQAQQQEQIQKITESLNQITSTQELNNLAISLNIQNEAIVGQSPKNLKNQISQAIQTAAQNAYLTANAAKREQTKILIKQSVKINVGVIISGICFITIWKLTRWTRMIDKNVNQ
ncbi:MAG: hypothetical protein IGS49_06780 [Chlorogloeopsis fritschii C42_A2020_084]|nr:hypothetical protein [Chlorogloeopsis fritschii C42_A2020_084]